MKVLIEFDDYDRELLARMPAAALPSTGTRYVLGEGVLQAWNLFFPMAARHPVLNLVVQCQRWQFFNERPSPGQRVELPAIPEKTDGR